jgi:nicotinate-nucleotide adenylyltransferase
MDLALAGNPRVAFFGGSFDPPHLGHLAVAQAAKKALGLDTVLFAPVGAQPLKPHGSSASFEDRLAMTRLAIAKEAGFAVSLADAPKPSGEPNYTFESLCEIRSTLPAGAVLFCLMGADTFVGFRQWHRAAEVPFVAPLVVASRPGERLDELEAALPEGLWLAGEPEVVKSGGQIELRRSRLRNRSGEERLFFVLPGLEVEISATRIREWIREERCATMGGGTKGQELLTGSVLAYICAHGLYL